MISEEALSVGRVAYIRYQCTVGSIHHAKIDETEVDGSESPSVDSWIIPSRPGSDNVIRALSRFFREGMSSRESLFQRYRLVF